MNRRCNEFVEGSQQRQHKMVNAMKISVLIFSSITSGHYSMKINIKIFWVVPPKWRHKGTILEKGNTVLFNALLLFYFSYLVKKNLEIKKPLNNFEGSEVY